MYIKTNSANSIWVFGALFLLGTGLTLASFRYVRPGVCEQVCDEPEGAPCPSGACRFGEQRAGFPLPVRIDDPGGSSPTSGWGRLGPEDLPNPLSFAADVLFYTSLLWLAWQAVQLLRDQPRPKAALRLWPLLLIPLAVLLAGVSIERSFATRGEPRRTGKPEEAILGKWSAKDPLTGEEYIVRFYGHGRASMTLPGYPEPGPGEYQWESGDKIRLNFQWASPIQQGEGGLCRYTPAFIQVSCQPKMVQPPSLNPAAYPAPVQTSLAIPTQAAERYPAPGPAPTPEPWIESRIDGIFEVEIEGDRMALTAPSGQLQTFQRAVDN